MRLSVVCTYVQKEEAFDCYFFVWAILHNGHIHVDITLCSKSAQAL